MCGPACTLCGQGARWLTKGGDFKWRCVDTKACEERRNVRTPPQDLVDELLSYGIAGNQEQAEDILDRVALWLQRSHEDGRRLDDAKGWASRYASYVLHTGDIQPPVDKWWGKDASE